MRGLRSAALFLAGAVRCKRRLYERDLVRRSVHHVSGTVVGRVTDTAGGVTDTAGGVTQPVSGATDTVSGVTDTVGGTTGNLLGGGEKKS